MKSKYMLLFLLALLFIPFVQARFSVDFQQSTAMNEYCEIYDVNYKPEEFTIFDVATLSYSIYNLDTSNGTQVEWKAFKFVPNITNASSSIFTNATNVTKTGWLSSIWNWINKPGRGGFQPLPLGSTVTYAAQYMETVSLGLASTVGITSNLEALSSMLIVPTTGSLNSFSFNPYTDSFNVNDISSYRLLVCQNRTSLDGHFFLVEVNIPAVGYTPCDTKSDSNYLYNNVKPIKDNAISFFAVVYELWFVIYWMLKIGIIIGVIFGAIWLIMYIYRLVRDSLR